MVKQIPANVHRDDTWTLLEMKYYLQTKSAVKIDGHNMFSQEQGNSLPTKLLKLKSSLQ